MRRLVLLMLVMLAGSASAQTPAGQARRLLETAVPQPEREKLAASVEDAGAVVRELAERTPAGEGLESAVIPWVWRVAIAAGRRNDPEELRSLLAASLPEKNGPPKEWQAVVIGGGIINGISEHDQFPGPRMEEVLRETPDLAARWRELPAAAAPMADDPQVADGTRYDALRIIAMGPWKEHSAQLRRHLAGDNAELQQGAVSGLVDVQEPEAAEALVAAWPGLTGSNRRLAAAGLLRTAERARLLADAVAEGRIPAAEVPAESARRLRERLPDHPAVRLLPVPAP